MVCGSSGDFTVGPPERTRLGLWTRWRRLLPRPARRRLLPPGHTPLPRLLRIQQLLSAERQLRYRLLLRWNCGRRQKRSKLWVLQVSQFRASLRFAIVSEELPPEDCGNLDPPMSKHQIRISIYCICSWLSRILVVRDLQTKANQSVYTKNSSLDGQMFHDWTSGQISVILFRRR